MSYKWDRVHVWAGEVADQTGGVAQTLSHLAQAGADLEYIFTQRTPEKPGTGFIYVAPISGPAVVRAARSAKLAEVEAPIVHRIEGDDEAGLGHRLTHAWAIAGLSFHGLTLASVGNKFIGYAAFDTVTDANRAAQILADIGSASGKK